MKSLVPTFNNAIYNASKPLIGDAQKASFTQGVNQGFGQQANDILSRLGKSGALNSGRAASTLTNLGLGKQKTINDYLAQVPVINQQNSQQQLLSLLGQGMNWKIPYGTTSVNIGNGTTTQSANATGTTQQSGTSQSTGSQTAQNSGGLLGGLGGLFGDLLGPTLGALSGGLSSAVSGLFTPKTGVS